MIGECFRKSTDRIQTDAIRLIRIIAWTTGDEKISSTVTHLAGLYYRSTCPDGYVAARGLLVSKVPTYRNVEIPAPFRSFGRETRMNE